MVDSPLRHIGILETLDTIDARGRQIENWRVSTVARPSLYHFTTLYRTITLTRA